VREPRRAVHTEIKRTTASLRWPDSFQEKPGCGEDVATLILKLNQAATVCRPQGYLGLPYLGPSMVHSNGK